MKRVPRGGPRLGRDSHVPFVDVDGISAKASTMGLVFGCEDQRAQRKATELFGEMFRNCSEFG